MRWWWDVQLTVFAWVACVLASVLAGLLVLLAAGDPWGGWVHGVGFVMSFPAAFRFWGWRRARVPGRAG